MLMQKEKYAVVVGCANIDIGGKAFDALRECDSNPGIVRLSYGGVGRNIAHNLALLGIRVYLLTALGTDDFSPGLLSYCEQSGIDMSYAAKYDGEHTSTYVYVADPDGDMRVAVCDAQISKRIDESYLHKYISILNGAAAVIIDGNLEQTAIQYIVENCTVPIFADPVSVNKAKKFLPVLSGINTIKPNIYEAEILSGVKITDMNTIKIAAENILRAGTKKVYISMGTNGLYCAEKNEKILEKPCRAKLINATGGGDAVVAMLVKAHIDALPMRTAAKYAMAAGAIAVEAEGTVNNEMCMEKVLTRAQEMET